MSSLKQKAIYSPFVVISELFERYVKSGEDPIDFSARNGFQEIFKTLEDRRTIPSMNDSNPESLNQDTLVRFRCMVQDTGLGQEMFVAVHRLVDPQTHSEKLACYKYTNIPSPGEKILDSRFPSRNVSDRTSTYCISPPGESLWVTRAYASTDNRATIQNLYTNETSEMLNATMIKKYPIPHKAHVSAVVKIYDTEISLNVGQMVEVIGILSPPMKASISEEEEEEEEEEENITTQQNESFIETSDDTDRASSISFSDEPDTEDSDSSSRLNKLRSKDRDLYHAQRTAEKQTHELMDGNLSQYDDIPIIHAIFVVPMSGKSEMFTEQDTKRVLKSASTTRDSLIDYLSTAFRGDKLASEYMMLQLISRITAQKDDIKIGQFSLNLYNFETSSIHTIKSNDGNVLYTLQDPSSMWLLNILKNIVPLLVEMPLNIEVFNNSSFSPESINENLHAGILQLLPGTLLLLDETVLSEGILQKIGVRNIQALMHVMHRQSLRYMFPFDEFEFDVDLSVFTISMRKSILPHHCVLRIESDATTFSNKYKKVPLHTSKDIQDFRIFLEASKYADYEISDEMAKYIQDEFVKERKEAEANNTALPTEEDLSLRLSLSRLVTVSFGKKSLTKEYYQHAMTMEMERKQRTLNAKDIEDAEREKDIEDANRLGEEDDEPPVEESSSDGSDSDGSYSDGLDPDGSDSNDSENSLIRGLRKMARENEKRESISEYYANESAKMEKKATPEGTSGENTFDHIKEELKLGKSIFPTIRKKFSMGPEGQAMARVASLDIQDKRDRLNAMSTYNQALPSSSKAPVNNSKSLSKTGLSKTGFDNDDTVADFEIEEVAPTDSDSDDDYDDNDNDNDYDYDYDYDYDNDNDNDNDSDSTNLYISKQSNHSNFSDGF